NGGQINLRRDDCRQQQHSIAHQRLPAQLRRAGQVQVGAEQVDGCGHTAYYRRPGSRESGVGSRESVGGTLEDYGWLISEAAAPRLAIAAEALASMKAASAAQVERLRKDLSAERAHLIVEQVALRERARRK